MRIIVILSILWVGCLMFLIGYFLSPALHPTPVKLQPVSPSQGLSDSNLPLSLDNPVIRQVNITYSLEGYIDNVNFDSSPKTVSITDGAGKLYGPYNVDPEASIFIYGQKGKIDINELKKGQKVYLNLAYSLNGSKKTSNIYVPYIAIIK